ncbi:MAG: ABC transporter permease [Chloroflexota bacterium]
MLSYIIKRVFQIVITFFLFLCLSYLLMEAMPGDFGQVFLDDPSLTAEQREALRAGLGLDRPPHERFLIYLGNLATGDMGISFTYYPQPVSDILLERAPRTIMLFLTATIVSFYVGFFAGKVLAWRRGGTTEYVTTVGGVMLFTVFTPWFALLMMWLFASNQGLDLLPLGKFIRPEVWRDAPVTTNEVFNPMLLTMIIVSTGILSLVVGTRRLVGQQRLLIRSGGSAVLLAGAATYWLTSGIGTYALDIAYHLILPILTLTLINFAGTMLLTRNSMLETLREDYIATARAKGLPDNVIRDKHAARNALLPVVTSFVFSLAFAFSGGIITENVFSWPGMGAAFLEAAQTQDVPMVMGTLVFIGLLAMLAHLAADILYAFLDPRIRYA